MCFQINKFVNLVSQCAKSLVYKTRELAARALVPLLTENTAYSIVRKLFLVSFTARNTRISANLLHGYLLQVRRQNLIIVLMYELNIRIEFYKCITSY